MAVGAIKVYNKGSQPTRVSETKCHVYCVTTKSHITQMGTGGHHPSFPHSYTYLWSAIFIVNSTQQHGNETEIIQSRVNAIVGVCSCAKHKAHFHATR